MAIPSLITELDDLVRSGNTPRQNAVLHRIGTFFLESLARYQPHHVAIFDTIFTQLAPHTSVASRARLSEQLAPLANGPRHLIELFAHDDEIAIAGPPLRLSPLLDEPLLIDVARLKGQPHLHAIALRASLSPPLTDVIIRRGNRDVTRTVADNAGASFSSAGYDGLIKRCSRDRVLALVVGRRADLVPHQLEALLDTLAEPLRRRLIEAVDTNRRNEIARIVSRSERTDGISAAPPDFTQAYRAMQVLHADQKLDEIALFAFAREHRYEEVVAALAVLSDISPQAVDRLLRGSRSDPVLLLSKALMLQWPTVQALLGIRRGAQRVMSITDLDEARANYQNLVPATAGRIVAFWRSQPALSQSA